MSALELGGFDRSAENTSFRTSETTKRLKTFATSAGSKLLGALSMLPAEADTKLSEHKLDESGNLHKSTRNPMTAVPTFFNEHPYLAEQTFRATEQAKYLD